MRRVGMPPVILVMMLCTFTVGTAESVVAGLLEELARDLDVSVSAAGQLVTVYAATVVVIGPLVALATTRIPRRTLLLVMMGVFALGNVLVALAPGYAAIVGGRLVSAAAHSMVFTVCLVFAGQVVAPERRSAAAARIILGVSLATVLGLPIGTYVGQQVGWRATFWLIAGLAVVSALLLARTMPHATAPGAPEAAGHGAGREELRALARRPVIVAIVLTTLAAAATFAMFTYVVPLLTDVSGFGDGTVTLLLVGYGLGGCAGSLVGGRLADRALTRTITLGLAASAVTLLALAATAPVKPLAVLFVVLAGACYFATIPGLNTAIGSAAGLGAATLALTLNGSAFNVGIAAGGGFGGLVIDSGLGVRWVPALAGALVAAGAVISAAEALRLRRPDRRARRAARSRPPATSRR